MANFFGGIKAKLKGKVVEAGLRNVQKRIDTPEEIKAIVSGIHVPGVPAKYTWLMSGILAVVAALLEAASHSDPALAVANPKAWVLGVLQSVDWSSLWMAAYTFVSAKAAFWTKQDSHNSTAVVPISSLQG